MEDLGKIYVDYHNYRRCYSGSSDGSGGEDGIKYLGISTTNPATEGATVKGNVITNPKEGSMVIYNSKEFMWRKDSNGIGGWIEIGDEDAFAWDED